MHNPLMIMAVAAYVTLWQLGMLLVALTMPADPRRQSTGTDTSIRRRAVAGGMAYSAGIIAAVAYAVMRRERAQTHATYWAIVLILLFGLSFAVYMAVPKLVKPDPTPEDQQVLQKWHDASAAVSVVALLGAGVTWVVARNTMKPK